MCPFKILRFQNLVSIQVRGPLRTCRRGSFAIAWTPISVRCRWQPERSNRSSRVSLRAKLATAMLVRPEQPARYSSVSPVPHNASTLSGLLLHTTPYRLVTSHSVNPPTKSSQMLYSHWAMILPGPHGSSGSHDGVPSNAHHGPS